MYIDCVIMRMSKGAIVDFNITATTADMNQIGKTRHGATAFGQKFDIFKRNITAHLTEPAKAGKVIDSDVFG